MAKKSNVLMALALSLAFLCAYAESAKAQAPNYLRNAPLWLQQGKVSGGASVTAASAPIGPLPGGQVAWVCNTGANDAYLALGAANTVTATVAASSWLKAGTCGNYDLIKFGVLQTYIAAITATSTTTLTIETGTGTGPTQLVASGGGGGGSSAPYSFSPSSTTNSDQHNLPIVTATALTVPSDATFAQVCVTGTKVNYRWDGTSPSATVGQPLLSSQCFFFQGRNILLGLKFIQTAASATLDVSYSK